MSSTRTTCSRERAPCRTWHFGLQINASFPNVHQLFLEPEIRDRTKLFTSRELLTTDNVVVALATRRILQLDGRNGGDSPTKLSVEHVVYKYSNGQTVPVEK